MTACRPQRLLVAGFGNVGRALAEIIANRQDYPALAPLEAEVVAITTGNHGALMDPEGIDLAAALAAFRSRGRFASDLAGFAELSTLEAACALDYDVLVELTPLTIESRGEPATSHLRAALERGRHVISCNKGPIAWGYRELAILARQHGVQLLFEGTVMGGVPVFNLARHCLRGNRVLRLEGILNSTTNVVLGAMEGGASLDDAVAEAQRLGVAEADPSLDLNGWDGAVKLAALVNALMEGELAPEQVERCSVVDLPAERLSACRAQGGHLKVVCEAVREGDTVRAGMALRSVSLGDPLATVTGTGSALRLVTDLMGTITLLEEHPDLHTTAYAVISDLLQLFTDP